MNKDAAATTENEGKLLLVNRDCPYTGGLSADALVKVGPACDGEILMEREAASMLEKLMESIGGWEEIAAVSGWRSREEQKRLWDDSLEENGEEFTKKFVALPGASEHETGLAIDLAIRQKEIDFLTPDFPDMGACSEFKKRAADYGFILRYPAGKEAVTGIAHEPWHFRYVGIPHAGIMEKNKLTLEEYEPKQMKAEE